MSTIEYDQNFEAKLVKKNQISHDTYLFGFSSEANIKLLPAEHFRIMMKNQEGIEINRSYTPILSQEKYFEVPIKIYQNGQMTQILDKLKINSHLIMQKRLGKLAYAGLGKFIVGPKINKQFQVFKTLFMICGGTGITPAYSVIQNICQNKDDQTKMYLIYANKTEGDILLKEQLDNLQQTNQNFQYINILNEEPNYNGYKGYVTLDIVKKIFPLPTSDSIGTHCGPTAMNKIIPSIYKEFGVKTIVKF